MHRELKQIYAGEDGQTEADVGGFVADGINAAGEYIEIQTGDFGSFKKKAVKLTLRGKLKIVYPVIIAKYLEVYDPKGKRLLYRRKSPKKGSAWELFNELIYAPDLPLLKGLTVELVLIDVLEQRVRDGKGSWRRKGLSIRDRQMLALHEHICMKKPSDYLRFIPFKKGEEFTSALLSEKAGISARLARKTLYALTKIGVVERVGKQGNALVYRVVSSGKIKAFNRKSAR